MNGVISSNIKSLKMNYIFHIILYVVIIIINFILLKKIFWLKDYFYYLYLSGSLFSIIYFVIPIIPLIFILKQKLTKKNIRFFKILSIIFCIISIIVGLFFSGLLMMNAIESPAFCRDCPFNLDISYLYKEFNDYFGKKINSDDKTLEKKCSNKNCQLNSENITNIFTYEYICNYDPTDEFKELSGPFIKQDENNNPIISDYEIKCNKLELINDFNFKKEIIYKYYDICKNFDDFYICERFNKPTKFSLEDFVCPNGNYMTDLIFYCVLNVLANLILSFIPWKNEYNIYDSIISYYRTNRRRNMNNSLNSTKHSSKIQNDNIQEKDFEKAPTETIIVCSDRKNNINNQNLNNENQINIINNIIHINKNKIISINNNIDNINNISKLEPKEEDINNIRIFNNTEENELNKIENKEKKNEIYISNQVISSERIILSNNRK